MQFKVPQFLEIEDKIFGPFTFRQFIYLAGAAGLCFTLYKLLGLALALIPILAIAGFGLMLTFYRPNNKPFVNMLESGFKYFTQSRLYIWKKSRERKEDREKAKKEKAEAEEESVRITALHRVRLDQSRLRDLAWSLDVLDLTKEKNTNV